MATGYTFPVVNGAVTTVGDFLYDIARAYLYDEDELPKQVTAENYHRKRLLVERLELSRLTALKKKDAKIKYGKTIIARVLKTEKESREKVATERQRVEDLLAKVNKWKAPKALKHQKAFMVSQLQETLNHMVTISHYDKSIAEWEAMSPIKVYQDAVATHRRNIQYHLNGQKEDIANAARTNKWLAEVHAAVKDLKKRKL